MKWFKRIFHTIIFLVIALMFITLFARTYISREPDTVKEFITSGGADPTAEQVQISKPMTNYTDGGLFYATTIEYQEQLGEWQIVVRYNHSTLTSIADKLDVSVEELGEEPFRYTLSNDKGDVYEPYASVSAEGPLHDFRRIAFSGVDTENVQKLKLTVWPKEYAEEEGVAIGEIVIWGYYYGAST